jgi:fibronectin-binding autotransporter adhesin
MNPFSALISYHSSLGPSVVGRSLVAASKAIAVGALCVSTWGAAQAGTLSSWSGATNTNWGTSTNWSTAVNSTGTFALVFGGTTRTSTVNNLGTVKADFLSFTNNGSFGRSSGFTIASGTLQLISGTVRTTQVTTGTLSNTISSAVVLNGSGTSTFDIGDRNNVTISGAISGGELVKTGLGFLSLTGSTNLSKIQINRGNVLFNSVAYQGLNGKVVDLGSPTFNSGALVFNAVTGTTNVQLRMEDNGILATQGANNVVFSNPNFNVATTSSNVILTLNGGAGVNIGTMTINGAIQDNTGGTLGVAISQGNTWVLNGANTYTGPTTVASPAKLLVNGDMAAGTTTSVAGYLGGSGTFAGSVSMTSSGTLSPGGTSVAGGLITDTIGKLTMANLTLGSSVTTQLTVADLTSYDQIVGSNSLTYGGNLALTLTGTQAYAKDTIFNLFKDFSSRSGDFSSITLAAAGTPYSGLTFTNLGGGIWETGSTAAPLGEYLRFEQSTGNLVVVPEPSTFVLAGLGAVLAGAQVWRRRRRVAA